MLNLYRIVRVFNRRTGRYVQARVDLTIDVDDLCKTLGAKALLNKSGKTKLVNGTIVAFAKTTETTNA